MTTVSNRSAHLLQSDNSASDLQLADAYRLVRTANQLVTLLEQQSPPLRTPLPRPEFEQNYRNLAEWDYDPDEIPKAIEKLRQRRWADLTLTVPSPQRALPDEVIEKLPPITGSEERLEFIFALLVGSGLLQPGSPVTVWPDVKTAFLRQSELAQRAVLARTYFNLFGELERDLGSDSQPQNVAVGTSLVGLLLCQP